MLYLLFPLIFVCLVSYFIYLLFQIGQDLTVVRFQESHGTLCVVESRAVVWGVCTKLLNSTSFPGVVDGPLAGLSSSEDMGRREISIESLVECQICPNWV